MKRYKENKYTVIGVNVKEMLQFFDEKLDTRKGDATAIVQVCGEDLGAGLFVHYIENQGYRAEVYSDKCTTGKSIGRRLDRWIKVIKNNVTVYYQTEIKNWSAHAIGEKVLPIDATEETLVEHKTNHWNSQWDSEKETFRNKAVGKVLHRMAKPIKDCKVEPLVIFWFAMHPVGKEEPFFSHPVRDENFRHVNVFSISSYLRQTKEEILYIPMPDATRRLDWFDRLFSK